MRVIYSVRFPYLAGKEGTVISAVRVCTRGDGTQYTGVLVDIDGMGNTFPDTSSPVGSSHFAPTLDALEPILYDGHRPIETEHCIINPDGTYNPDGDVPLTVNSESLPVVNYEEELYI